MPGRAWFLIVILILLVFALFARASRSLAQSAEAPGHAATPYELVDAVNALRASFGLAPYNINSILMSTAQAQADFMASTGTMTHSGSGGIGLTERLLAAGYPLAGDLSLGGFRAENITGGNEDMPAEAAVDRWTGDAPHLNTMVSPNLTEIGAGVAVSNGRVYYVIDAARPTTAGAPPAVATSIVSGAPVPEAVPEIIIPVSVSTPNADGIVFHDVKFGQTLWQIAITYEVKIDEIKRLNNLYNNNIYPGSTLLIKQEMIVPTSLPTEAAMLQTVTSTSLPTMTATTKPVASTPETATLSTSTNSTTLMNVMIGIIALAVVGGGIVAWIGAREATGRRKAR